jgi:hypothetical protein
VFAELTSPSRAQLIFNPDHSMKAGQVIAGHFATGQSQIRFIPESSKAPRRQGNNRHGWCVENWATSGR